MKTNDVIIEPPALWSALVERSKQALGSGALQPIESDTNIVDDQGVRFLVRVARNPECQKAQARKLHGEQPFNPFLPPEPELTLGAISESHLAVLNKFNVVDHHLLLVTRVFEDQENLLTIADFEALRRALVAFDGLGFYNGGKAAGASQRHKHLQIIPLPLDKEGPAVPVDAPIQRSPADHGIITLPTLPFRHRFVRLDPDWPAEATGSPMVHAHYLGMLHQLRQPPIIIDGQMRQSAPYNLLVTRRWMLLVPRVQTCFENLSINAMPFAGSFLVKNDKELARVRAAGPMRILGEVSGKI